MIPDEQSDRYAQFTELVSTHHVQVYRYIFAIVRDFSATDDVVQEAYLSLWEKFETYEPDTKFVSWACEVARNKALNFLTSRRRHMNRFSNRTEEQLADLAARMEIAPDDVRFEALDHCMDLLPGDQNELATEAYSGQATIAEIAEGRGRTVGSIHSSLRNIRTKLFDCVHRYLAREGNQ